MRTIGYHKINAANDGITIAADAVGAGGASHVYEVSGPGGESFAKVSIQNGPIKEVGVNGATNEALIAIVIDRLRCFQSGPFSCRENALALTKMEEALHWLNARTAERVMRGVEGKNIA